MQHHSAILESFPLRRGLICNLFGQCDSGKTSLRRMILQSVGEVVGQTIQRASFIPLEAITRTLSIGNEGCPISTISGLFIVDKPGMESTFAQSANLRCDMAIVVVDIHAGLESQSIEALHRLQGKIPFVVALNKLDRLAGWKTVPHHHSILEILAGQSPLVKKEYEDRIQSITDALTKLGLQVSLSPHPPPNIVPVVATSAHTKDGIPALLESLLWLSQAVAVNSSNSPSNLSYPCTILGLKYTEGWGLMLDCLLTSGTLREGDRIALCGVNKPIFTTIKAILTTSPSLTRSFQDQYTQKQFVTAPLVIKLSAPGLEEALPGSRLILFDPLLDETKVAEDLMKESSSQLDFIKTARNGVTVHSSSVGALEALVKSLTEISVPVAQLKLGPIHSNHILEAASKLSNSFPLILGLNVEVKEGARQVAEEAGMKIFTGEVIYHLIDQVTAYIEEDRKKRQSLMYSQVVFPCILKIVPAAVFHTRNPLIVGVTVVEGTLKLGTPLCVPTRKISIGTVTGMQLTGEDVTSVRRGDTCAIKIEQSQEESGKILGRHFDENDELVSALSRYSIDVLKEHFREEIDREMLLLLVKLKRMLDIV